MTVFKRGPEYLTCLMCGYGDFDSIRLKRSGGKALRCIRCGFMFKEGRYFTSMPRSTPVPADGSSLYSARNKGLTEVNKK